MKASDIPFWTPDDLDILKMNRWVQLSSLFIKLPGDMIRIRSQRCNYVLVQVRLSTRHLRRDELWQPPSITSTRQTNREQFTSRGGSKMSIWRILDMMLCYWNIKEIAHAPCLIQRIHKYVLHNIYFHINVLVFFVVLLCFAAAKPGQAARYMPGWNSVWTIVERQSLMDRGLLSCRAVAVQSISQSYKTVLWCGRKKQPTRQCQVSSRWVAKGPWGNTTETALPRWRVTD